MEPLRLLVSVAALLAVIFIAAQVMIMRRRHPRAGAMMLILRLIVLGLGALLVWRALWGGHWVEKAETPDSLRNVRCLVLQDQSLSMECRADIKAQRKDLADDAWQQLKTLAHARPGHRVELVRYFFARNRVTENRAGDLKRGATLLGRAFEAVFEDRAPNAVLILSDGAASDEVASKVLLDRLAIMHTPVYGIICGLSPEAHDVALKNVACPGINPNMISYVIEQRGFSRHPLTVTLKIDGDPIAQTTCTVERAQSFVLPLSQQAKGWHEFELAIAPLPGEDSELNNVQRGIFKSTPSLLIVPYITDVPRKEDRHLVRLLKLTLSAVTNVEIKAGASLLENMSGRAVIFSDVDPGHIPPRWLNAIRAGDTTALVLFGKHFDSWCEWIKPDFPVSGSIERVDLTALQQPEAGLFLNTDVAPPELDLVPVDKLKISLVTDAQPAGESKVLLAARSADRIYPLVIVDRLPSPRWVTLLCDTTWKWDQNPDPEVRKQFQSFFQALFQNLFSEPSDDTGLRLEFVERPETEEVLVRVRPVRANELAHIQNVQLRIRTVNTTNQFTPSRELSGWSYRLADDKPGEVQWFQAFGRLRGKEILSENRPFRSSIFDREIQEIDLQPDVIRNMTPHGPGNWAWYADAKSVLEKLVAGLNTRPSAPVRQQKQRDTQAELWLAGLLMVLLCAEWFIERWLAGG